jgi:hypothetical protein
MSVITKFTLESALLAIDIPVADAKPTDRYILRGVDGLGPPEINVSMGNALYQGGVYRGSQPSDREIVIRLSLNPEYSGTPISADKLRAYLYSNLAGQFSSRFTISSRSYEDETPPLAPPEMYVEGYVRSIAITPFEKDSVVQVTMRCPEAWFKTPGITILESVSDILFQYDGSAPTGFYYRFTASEAASKLHIQAESTAPEYEIIELNYTFMAGDIIEFNSNPGFRMVRLIRDPNPNAVDITGFSIIKNNLWPSLRPGPNTIRVYKDTWDLSLVKTDENLQYTKQYWGV